MFHMSSLRREMGEGGTCEFWAADCSRVLSRLKVLDSRASFWSTLVLALENSPTCEERERANNSSLPENCAVQGAFNPPPFPQCLLLTLFPHLFLFSGL